MAQCAYCNKKGFFLKINKLALCNKCEPVLVPMIKRHFQIIDESIEIVEKSKNLIQK